MKSFHPGLFKIRHFVGEPFTGKWLIKAPNGQFLSLINLDAPFKGLKTEFNFVITTSPKRSFNALFKLQQQSKQSRIQLVHDANKENTLFRVSPKTEAISLFVEELRPLSGEFAIVNQAKNQWLEMGEKNTFKWTDREEKRAVFSRVAKMALFASPMVYVCKPLHLVVSFLIMAFLINFVEVFNPKNELTYWYSLKTVLLGIIPSGFQKTILLDAKLSVFSQFLIALQTIISLTLTTLFEIFLQETQKKSLYGKLWKQKSIYLNK